VSTASLVASDRSEPEDVVHVVRTETSTAFVVADGAGGIGGGRRAARLVVEAFQAALDNVSRALETSAAWCEFLVQLDEQITRDASAGESTAVIAVILDGLVIGASVGDSEAWLITPADRCVLTSGQQKARLGSGRAAPVAFEAVLDSSWLIVAATDGLFHAVAAAAICEAVRTTPTPEALVALARSRSGKLYDDVGIVIVRP
jgi:PPM family protein phosphatase